MAAEGLITLVPEIPDVGVGGRAKILVGGVAGEEGPLGIHRAAGKNVGQQVAGDGLFLQGVPGGVDLEHALLAGQRLEV